MGHDALVGVSVTATPCARADRDSACTSGPSCRDTVRCDPPSPGLAPDHPVHLPSFVSEMLGRHMENVPDDPEALVFTAPQGGPLRYSNFRRSVWDPARGRAGEDLEDITPHHLRHTCASLMRAAGADVKAIQQQLGHRNASVTLDTYTHLFEGDLDEVMERLDVASANNFAS